MIAGFQHGYKGKRRMHLQERVSTTSASVVIVDYCEFDFIMWRVIVVVHEPPLMVVVGRDEAGVPHSLLRKSRAKALSAYGLDTKMGRHAQQTKARQQTTQEARTEPPRRKRQEACRSRCAIIVVP